MNKTKKIHSLQRDDNFPEFNLWLLYIRFINSFPPPTVEKKFVKVKYILTFKVYYNSRCMDRKRKTKFSIELIELLH